MSNYQLPFEYGTVHLYDELKHLALRQQLDKAQFIDQDLEKALAISTQIEKILKESAIKRYGVFSKESIYYSFGILAHIRKSGRLGKILAFLLDPVIYFKNRKK